MIKIKCKHVIVCNMQVLCFSDYELNYLLSDCFFYNKSRPLLKNPPQKKPTFSRSSTLSWLCGELLYLRALRPHHRDNSSHDTIHFSSP